MISADEASDQLAYVRRVSERARLRTSGAYRHFIIWGAAWAIGYMSHPFVGDKGGVGLWPIVLTVGGVMSAVVGMRDARTRTPQSGDRRPMAVLAVFYFGLLAVPSIFLREVDAGLIAAYFPFVFGMMFLAAGFYLGRIFTGLGGVMMASSLVSIHIPWTAQNMFIGAVDGVGLLLLGVWLRAYLRAPSEP
jgi:hypothetical protein